MILANFLVGLAAMLVCLAIQAYVAFWCVRHYVRQTRRLKPEEYSRAGMRPLLVAMIAMMLGTFIQVGLWGVLFLVLGEFTDLYEAVYHSAVNFASLGYGDIVMSKYRKLLGPLEAINGVLMLGMSAAALMVILQQLVKLQYRDDSQAADEDGSQVAPRRIEEQFAARRLLHANRRAARSSLGGILVELRRSRRQLHPRVPAAVVNRNAGRRKARVGECSDSDAHGPIVTFFGVKDRGPADRAEPESELRPLVADADIFGGGAEDLEWSGKAGECSEDAAGPLLTCEAVADANPARFALDLNAQLAAGARGGSRWHARNSTDLDDGAVHSWRRRRTSFDEVAVRVPARVPQQREDHEHADHQRRKTDRRQHRDQHRPDDRGTGIGNAALEAGQHGRDDIDVTVQQHWRRHECRTRRR